MAATRAPSTSSSSSVSRTATTAIPTYGDDTLLVSGDVTIDGLGGNDRIIGGSGNQVLLGSNGNDTLESTSGNDTLIGGVDDDLYVMGDNTGQNIIINVDSNPLKNDVLYLKDVDESELREFQRIGNDIIIRWGANSQVTLKDVYLGEDHQISTFTLKKFQSTYQDISYTMREVLERYTFLLTDGDDTLGPSDLNENVRGGNGNDKIDMGAGNDYLAGDEGDDTLDGGTGNDTMSGGAGNDVFVLRKGSGNDTIAPSVSAVGRIDLLRFEDVASDGLTAVLRSESHLILKYGESDQVTLTNFFVGASGNITHIQFSGGQLWDMAQLFAAHPIQMGAGDDKAPAFPSNLNETIRGGAGNDIIGAGGGNDAVYGEDGSDSLSGDAGTDTISGGDGTDTITGGIDNDTVYGDGGNDLIYGDLSNGGDGSDALYGGAGNDTLIGVGGGDTLDGGTGNDSLVGGSGNDVYILRVGSGIDVIDLLDTGANKVDVIRFEDVASTALTGVSRAGANLTLSYGNGDSVTFVSYYVNATTKFSTIQFSDGVSFRADQLFANYAVQMGNTGETLTFTDDAETILGGAGNDIIIAQGGNDRIDGEADNDNLTGGLGNDSVFGGAGNDTLYGSEGDDLLDGGVGDDSINTGPGNDTVVLRVGSGRDSVTFASTIKTLVFEDVMFDALTAVERNGDNLVLTYGTNDQVTLVNYFSGPSYELDNLVFADGPSTVRDILAAYPVKLKTGDDNVTFTRNWAETIYADGGNDKVDAGGGNDTVYGGAGNDSLTGGTGNDLLSGEDGRDMLTGSDGDDYLSGGLDNDSLAGDAGNDTLDGGAGNDTMTGGAGNDVYLLRVGSGIDTIAAPVSSAVRNMIIRFEDVASSGVTAVKRVASDLILEYGNSDSVAVKEYFALNKFNTIEFSDGVSFTPAQLFANYAIVLTSNGDTVSFSDDAEVIHAGAGNDVITALGGDDVLHGEADNDQLSGGAGDDSLYGDAGNDQLTGDAGDDRFDGGIGADTLLGGAGNDTLDGGTGNDSMTGGAGDDLYLLRVGSGVDTIDLGDTSTLKNKVIRFEDVDAADLWAVKRSGTNLVIEYGNGDSFSLTNFYGTAKFNTIEFADGMTFDQDLLFANYAVRMGATPESGTFTDSAETVYGGAGNDTIMAAGGDDVVFGEADNDSLLGGAGNDTLYGGSGNDQINGDAGDDKLEGGTGNDTITSNSGNDTIVFHVGDGVDVLNINDATAGRSKTLLFDGIGGMDLVSLQRIAGDLLVNYGAGDQVKIGSYLSANATIQTLKFTDVEWTMQDLYNNHAINLSSAGENLAFGALNEWVLAGAGNDIIDGGAGDDRLFGELGNDSLKGNIGADELRGGDGLDTLAGGAGDDKLYGDAGADVIVGEADNDWIDGGADNDNLSGDAGNDVLVGGDGNDTLNGGVGNDTMYGGAGNDSFTGAAGDDTYVLQLGSGVDTISALDTTAGRFESLVFEDVDISQVRSVTKVSNNLVIAYGSAEQVTVTGHFTSAQYAINAVQFSDGVNHTVPELMALFAGATAVPFAQQAILVGSQPGLIV